MKGWDRSLFGEVTKEIHHFLLSVKLYQLIQRFQLGEHKLFILNRFSVGELAAGMWSPWNCFVLRVYFPLAYTPQPMHELCSVWFVRLQRLVWDFLLWIEKWYCWFTIKQYYTEWGKCAFDVCLLLLPPICFSFQKGSNFVHSNYSKNW